LAEAREQQTATMALLGPREMSDLSPEKRSKADIEQT
jgi:hypothetical protein